jgi:uncharacterized protein (TIGR02597 family)
MNPESMKTRIFSASLALLISVLPSTGYGQASTPPVGVIVYTLTTGTTTPIGVPVFGEAAFAGNISAVTANTLTTEDADWTAGQFAQLGAPYFVLILSGGQTGRLLLVTGNTAGTTVTPKIPGSVTLDIGTTSLTGDAATPSFFVGVGDRFEIFPGDTLATLFGDGSVSNPVQLQTGTSPFTADSVQIFNGVKWVSYFFHSTNNSWTNALGVGTNQNNMVLFPDAGLMVARRGPTTTIAITGRAPTTNLVTRIVGGNTSSVAVRFPTDTTLGALNFSNPGTWVASDDSFSADRVSLFNGVKWVAFYKTLTGSVWKQAGGDGSDQSAKAIPAGSAVLIQKQGGATGSNSFFSQVLPYSPN